MNVTYNIKEGEIWHDAWSRNRQGTPKHGSYFAPAYQVESVLTYSTGNTRTHTLGTYKTRAAAELVVAALRAAQNDLT